MSFLLVALLTVCGNVKRNCREVEKYYNQTNNNIQDPKFDFITKMFLRSIAQDQRQDLDSRCAGNKQLLDEAEHDIMNYQNRGLCYLPKPKAEADNTDTRF